MTEDTPLVEKHSDLSPADVKVLLRAAHLAVDDTMISDVTHSLNALLEALASVDPAELEAVEPTPVVDLKAWRDY